MKENIDVAIVGAGLAGLAAAIELHGQGKKVKIYEAQPFVGGRVSTDDFQWYKLDRGFQVLLTAYPECKKILNYQLLELQSFEFGVITRYQGNFYTLYSPLKHPVKMLKELFKGTVNPSDLFKLIKLSINLKKADAQKLIDEPSGNALSVIKKYDFSPGFTEQFIKPFLRGVLLDHSLTCPGKMVNFLFKMFMEGSASVPTRGMKSIPKQLASRLSSDAIVLNTLVQSVQQNKIILHNGTVIEAKTILLACDPWSTCRLLGIQQPPPGREVANIYFSAKKAPFKEPLLVLNGDSNGIVNNLAVMSNVAPRYVEDRSALISVTVLEEGIKKAKETLEKSVVEELKEWYGPDVEEWRHLHTYRIRNAHPASYPLKLWSTGRFKVKDGVYACGDYLETPSLNSALLMGRKAAEQIIAEQK